MTKLTLGTSLSPEMQAKLDTLTTQLKRQDTPHTKPSQSVRERKPGISQLSHKGKSTHAHETESAQPSKADSSKDEQKLSKIAQADNERQQRYASRQASQAALAYLYETYPNAFKHDDIRPLKIGIEKDIFEQLSPQVSKVKLRAALSFYTRRIGYLQALVDGKTRIDLQGHDAGMVSDEQQAYAKQILTEALERQKERREKQKLHKEKQAEYRRRKEQPAIGSDDMK